MKFDAARIASQMKVSDPNITPAIAADMWAKYQAAKAVGLPEIVARETGSYIWGPIGSSLVDSGYDKFRVAVFFNELLAYNAGWEEADGRAESGDYSGSLSEKINDYLSGYSETTIKTVKIVGGCAIGIVSLYAISKAVNAFRGK